MVYEVDPKIKTSLTDTRTCSMAMPLLWLNYFNCAYQQPQQQQQELILFASHHACQLPVQNAIPYRFDGARLDKQST